MSTSVTPFSGKLILLIDGMVTSINIYMVVLEQLIVTLPAGNTTEPTGTAVTEPTTTTSVVAPTSVVSPSAKPTDVVVTEGPVEKPTEKPTEKPDTTTAPVDCNIYNMDYFSERNTMYNISINNLQDVKASISAAMSGLVAGSVDSSEYMTSLASIVSDLSIDMTNIDADRFSEFMSLSVDGSFSEEQLDSLISYEATIDSYISQLAVEIAMGYSFMQDVQMMNGNEGFGEEEGMEGEEEDVESLMEKEEMMMDNINNLNQTMEYMMNIEINCDMINENSPMDYYTFVINEFYLPLISTDMMEMNSLWGSVEFGPLSTFEMYNDQGVQCMSDTYQRDLMAVQVVLKVYIEMCQLHLAIIREEMLETTGES